MWVYVGPASWPLWITLCFMAASIAMRPSGIRIAARAFSALCLMLFVVPLDLMILRPLEGRYPSPARLPDRAIIVMLTGSERLALSERSGRSEYDGAAERVIATAELGHAHKAWPIWVVGGIRSAKGLRDVDIAARTLRQLGISGRRITLMDQSTTTWTNAVITGQKWRQIPKKDRIPIVLVTSAAHMPRAMMSFQAQGLEPIAYPVDYRALEPGEKPALDFDCLSILGRYSTALHEWIGIVAYKYMYGTTGV